MAITEIRDDFSADDLSSEAQKSMHAYWLKARGKGQIPPKTALDPVEFPRKALPLLTVVEPISDNDFKIRITGTGIRAATGHDFTGLKISEIDGTDDALEHLVRCRDDARTHFVTGSAEWDKKFEKFFSVLALPFGSPSRVERIVLVFSFTNYTPKSVSPRQSAWTAQRP